MKRVLAFVACGALATSAAVAQTTPTSSTGVGPGAPVIRSGQSPASTGVGPSGFGSSGGQDMTTSAVCFGKQGPSRMTLDFRAVSLRTAIATLALMQHARVVPLDSVPDSGPLNVCLADYSMGDAWGALLKMGHLSYVDDHGVRYVGTEQDLESRFPNSRPRQVRVFAFDGDMTSGSEMLKSLTDAVPGTAAFMDRADRTITVIGTPESLAQIGSLFAQLHSQSAGNIGAFSSSAVRVRNQTTDDVFAETRAALTPFAAPNTLVEARGTQSILVSGTPDFVKRAKDVIGSLDQPLPMMRLDVTVVALTPNDDQKNQGGTFGGVDAAGVGHTGSFNTSTSFVNKTLTVYATLNMLEQKGDAIVLSRGSLYARNGMKGSIDGTTVYPFVTLNGFTGTRSVEKFSYGAQINMTPTLLDSGMLVDVDASYSTLTNFTAENVPIIATNGIKDQLMLHDDEALVVSGFYSDLSTVTTNQLPVVSKLPIIGPLFNNKQARHLKTEVAFIVVPHKGADIDSFSAKLGPIGHPNIYDPAQPLYVNPTPAPTIPVHAVLGHPKP